MSSADVNAGKHIYLWRPPRNLMIMKNIKVGNTFKTSKVFWVKMKGQMLHIAYLYLLPTKGRARRINNNHPKTF